MLYSTKLLKYRHNNKIYIISQNESKQDAIERIMAELKDKPEELTCLLYHLDLIEISTLPLWCVSRENFYIHLDVYGFYTFRIN